MVPIPSRTPLISVIMPVYNPGRYLSGALESLLNQTYRNIEVIAINDGSTDNSLSVLERYQKQDNRLRVINQENQGLQRTLNRALGLVKGDFIARMDSDDICDVTRLERQIDYLSSHPDVDIVGTQHRIIGPSGELISVSDFPIEPAALEWAFFSRSVVASNRAHATTGGCNCGQLQVCSCRRL